MSVEDPQVPKYLTVQQVADHLALHPKTVQNYLRNGTILGKKVGKNWYINPSELRRLLDPKTV